MAELEGVKRGIQQDTGRGDYFRVSEKYRHLQKHKLNMSRAGHLQSTYNFNELEEHSNLLARKNAFFKNYLENGNPL